MLHVTRKCVRRIHILTVHRHGSPSAAFQPDKLNVCVFMTTYMIAFHSSVFFEEMGTLEQSLLDAATRLLDLFLSICKQLRAHKAFRCVPPETTRHFVPALWDFVKLFHAWKGPDNTKLIGRVRHALLALYNAERRLSPDLPTDSDMRVNFKTHINRLRAKLEELAGAEALRDFDTKRPPTTVPQLPITPLPVQISDDALTHEILVDPKFQFQVKDLADNSTLPKVRSVCARRLTAHTNTHTSPVVLGHDRRGVPADAAMLPDRVSDHLRTQVQALRPIACAQAPSGRGSRQRPHSPARERRDVSVGELRGTGELHLCGGAPVVPA